ncbi:heme peroxidase [Gloeophyllum trabeum ATCC 11539]|uniref:Heme peroxidase n=1 Tax=Gloeophyllum trabeum (strain ATCC 11539 / FP-39264 / Madison 617) TaxID=670483 RepID=S7Q1Z9_GLOTA|nr:heme peroxidase [Gloeophyllum trabeum ATCC 11539]EPQ54046.1 heme peroxidase [Gloeophyllum trabeum ATCC 11539]
MDPADLNDGVEQAPPPVLTIPQSRMQRITATFVNPIRKALGYKDEEPVEPQRQIDPAHGSYTAFAKLLRSPPINDRDKRHVFFAAMKSMTALPEDSPMRAKFNKTFIDIVNNQKRPAPRYLRSPAYHASVTPQPYARSADPSSVSHSLPDAASVFDGLLKAHTFSEHPNAISGMVPAFLAIVSLCLFRTKEDDPEFNDTSPYLDLSPLYGSKPEDEDLVRQKDGRGMLWPDCFFEDRLMFLTPAAQALLIVWNRNHNSIANRLLLEGGFPLPTEDSFSQQKLKEQDDKIFRTARLINCAMFKKVIVEDVLKGLLGLPSVGSTLNLDLLETTRSDDKPPKVNAPEHRSCIEFSLIYHWSFLSSVGDIEWMKGVMEQTFGSKDIADLTLDDYDNAVRNYKTEVDSNRRRRNLPGLLRGDDGLFDDNELAKPGLQAEDSSPGTGFGLGYTTTFGLLVDLVGAIRADPCNSEYTREVLTEWGYNECFGKSDIGSFGALLPKVLSRTLPQNYPYDNTYTLFPFTAQGPGQNALKVLNEQYNRARPCGTKILKTKGAISQVLNNPENYASCYSHNLKALLGGYGFLLGFDTKKLHDADELMILHALLPDKGILSKYAEYFARTADELILAKEGSVDREGSVDVVKDVIEATCSRWICNAMASHSFNWYPPFLIPPYSTMYEQKIPQAQAKYSRHFESYMREYCPPATRHNEAQTLGFPSYVFEFNEPDQAWTARARALKKSRRLMDDIAKTVEKTLATSEETLSERIARVYKEASGLPVGKLSPTPFLSRLAMKHRDTLRHFAGWDAIRNTADLKMLELFRDECWKPLPETQTLSHRDQLRRSLRLRELEEKFRSTRIAANILGLCIMSVMMTEVCARAVEFYLIHGGRDEKEEIIRISKAEPTSDNNRKIMGFIREAQRLALPPGLFRVARGLPDGGETIAQGDGYPEVVVYNGDRVFANFAAQLVATNDMRINPHRPNPYIHGLGFHKCPAISLVDGVLPELFKAIFRMENLRVGEGGRLTGGGTGGKQRSLVRRGTPLRSLIVKFDGVYKPPIRWKEPQSMREKSEWWQHIVHRIKLTLKVVVILFIILGVSILFMKVTPAVPQVHMPSLPRLRMPSIHMPNWFERTPQDAVCRQPLTAFDPWHAETIRPGPDGKPRPIEYTYKSRRPHRLSVVDIDKRDMQLELFVDGQSRGVTTEFTLDKAVDCGEDLRRCLQERFSAGVIEIPPGKHTVKIAWAGKEFVEGTRDIDWGADRVRRFEMLREDCS